MNKYTLISTGGFITGLNNVNGARENLLIKTNNEVEFLALFNSGENIYFENGGFINNVTSEIIDTIVLADVLVEARFSNNEKVSTYNILNPNGNEKLLVVSEEINLRIANNSGGGGLPAAFKDRYVADQITTGTKLLSDFNISVKGADDSDFINTAQHSRILDDARYLQFNANGLTTNKGYTQAEIDERVMFKNNPELREFEIEQLGNSDTKKILTSNRTALEYLTVPTNGTPATGYSQTTINELTTLHTTHGNERIRDVEMFRTTASDITFMSKLYTENQHYKKSDADGLFLTIATFNDSDVGNIENRQEILRINQNSIADNAGEWIPSATGTSIISPNQVSGAIVGYSNIQFPSRGDATHIYPDYPDDFDLIEIYIQSESLPLILPIKRENLPPNYSPIPTNITILGFDLIFNWFINPNTPTILKFDFQPQLAGQNIPSDVQIFLGQGVYVRFKEKKNKQPFISVDDTQGDILFITNGGGETSLLESAEYRGLNLSTAGTWTGIPNETTKHIGDVSFPSGLTQGNLWVEISTASIDLNKPFNFAITLWGNWANNDTPELSFLLGDGLDIDLPTDSKQVRASATKITLSATLINTDSIKLHGFIPRLIMLEGAITITKAVVVMTR